MLAYFRSNGMQEELQAYQLNDMKIIVRMNGLNLKTDQLNLCVILLQDKLQSFNALNKQMSI